MKKTSKRASVEIIAPPGPKDLGHPAGQIASPPGSERLGQAALVGVADLHGCGRSPYLAPLTACANHG